MSTSRYRIGIILANAGAALLICASTTVSTDVKIDAPTVAAKRFDFEAYGDALKKRFDYGFSDYGAARQRRFDLGYDSADYGNAQKRFDVFSKRFDLSGYRFQPFAPAGSYRLIDSPLDAAAGGGGAAAFLNKRAAAFL